jgi:hypothetical protein
MRYADTLLGDGEVVVVRRRQHWLALLVEGRAALALWLVALLLLASVWFFNLTGNEANILGLVALAGLGLGLLIFAWRYWQWWAQDYMVTNRRLLKVTGVINKRASSSALEKINDAILDQNLVGRLMNFGDIDILTASGELAIDYFRMIAGAKEFKRVLTNQKHALEMEYRFDRAPSPPLRASPVDMNGELVAPPPPPPSEPPPPPPTEPQPVLEAAEGDAAPSAAGVAQAAAPPEAAERSLDITQTLARLADLRDRGAITEEEYETKKDELLRRL